MPDPATRREPADRSLYSLAQIQHLMRVEFNRARRYRYPVVCMLVAIDRLGHLRDLYGYEAKESVVQTVVGLLMKVTRSSDFLGRTADDRLMAIVPHTPPEGARALAERLLADVRGQRFEIEGKAIGVTLSIGISDNQVGDPLFFDALLSGAESALARAAEQGGGRFVEQSPG